MATIVNKFSEESLLSIASVRGYKYDKSKKSYLSGIQNDVLHEIALLGAKQFVGKLKMTDLKIWTKKIKKSVLTSQDQNSLQSAVFRKRMLEHIEKWGMEKFMNKMSPSISDLRIAIKLMGVVGLPKALPKEDLHKRLLDEIDLYGLEEFLDYFPVSYLKKFASDTGLKVSSSSKKVLVQCIADQVDYEPPVRAPPKKKKKTVLVNDVSESESESESDSSDDYDSDGGKKKESDKKKKESDKKKKESDKKKKESKKKSDKKKSEKEKNEKKRDKSKLDDGEDANNAEEEDDKENGKRKEKNKDKTKAREELDEDDDAPEEDNTKKNGKKDVDKKGTKDNDREEIENNNKQKGKKDNDKSTTTTTRSELNNNNKRDIESESKNSKKNNKNETPSNEPNAVTDNSKKQNRKSEEDDDEEEDNEKDLTITKKRKIDSEDDRGNGKKGKGTFEDDSLEISSPVKKIPTNFKKNSGKNPVLSEDSSEADLSIQESPVAKPLVKTTEEPETYSKKSGKTDIPIWKKDININEVVDPKKIKSNTEKKNSSEDEPSEKKRKPEAGGAVTGGGGKQKRRKSDD